jgi:dTDP-4-dehydrorhamnose reductase
VLPVTALGRAQAALSDPSACAAAVHAHRPRAAINAKVVGAMAQACADLDSPCG